MSISKKYRLAKCLVLASPAFNQEKLLRRWYDDAQLRKWKKKGYLDTSKFRIGLKYLKEVKDYTETLSEIEIPTLILHGEKDEDIPLEIAKEALKTLKIKEKKMIIIPESDHHFESYLARQNIIKISKEWYQKYL